MAIQIRQREAVKKRLSLSEKVKILNFIGKKKKSYADVAKIYSQNKLFYL